jgi:hypothetical protein
MPDEIFSKNHEWHIERIAAILLFNVAWVSLLWVMFIGKLVVSGTHEYISHFTNWAWTINALFFLLDTVAKILSCANRRSGSALALYGVGFLFWIAHGMSWLVFWLVFIMFGDNPRVLTDLAGDYDMGFILDMDRIFHVLPSMILLIYVVLERRLIGWTIAVLVYRNSFRQGVGAWFYLLGVVLFGGLITLALYYASYDIAIVYGITTSPWLLLLLGVGVSIAFNGVVFATLRKRYVR